MELGTGLQILFYCISPVCNLIPKDPVGCEPPCYAGVICYYSCLLYPFGSSLYVTGDCIRFGKFIKVTIGNLVPLIIMVFMQSNSFSLLRAFWPVVAVVPLETSSSPSECLAVPPGALL